MLFFCVKISSDASLACYNVIVLDEVHERHLHGDYLLGVIKCLLQHRDDLRNGDEHLKNFEFSNNMTTNSTYLFCSSIFLDFLPIFNM